MTTVRFYPDIYRLEIKGHAGSAPAGQDLICAAESILAYQLIEAASDVPEYAASIYMNDRDGIIAVECAPDEEYAEQCRYMFEVVKMGFDILAARYPDYVKT